METGNTHCVVSTASDSYQQWRENSVSAIVQLVVGKGGVQVRRLLPHVSREAILRLLVQSGQLTASPTEHNSTTVTHTHTQRKIL